MSLFIHRNAGGRCPCGAENATCGPPSTVVPVDQLLEEVAAVSGPLKKYRVTRGGVATVMKLSDADAARLGVSADDVIGGVSTIPPVQLVEDGEADDGPADEGGSSDAAPGDAEGDQGTQPVQSAADGGGDGPTPSPTPAAAGVQQPPTAAPAPVKKAAARTTPTKRRTTAEDKARTGAQTKATGGDADA